jgi:hypothetical protein
LKRHDVHVLAAFPSAISSIYRVDDIMRDIGYMEELFATKRRLDADADATPEIAWCASFSLMRSCSPMSTWTSVG